MPQENSRNRRRILTRNYWILSVHNIDYPTFGGDVDDNAHFIISINKLATRVHHPVVVPHPPLNLPRQLADFIHLPFNHREFSLAPS